MVKVKIGRIIDTRGLCARGTQYTQSTRYTVCIKIIRIQIWHVITQNIFDKFGWFLQDC
jgi:hypothetical protein